MRPDTPQARNDAADFHAALRAACDRHDPGYYAAFKDWCDRVFLPAAPAAKPRGVGGIFYDHHFSGDAAADFAFTRDVGLAFLDAYPRIVRRRMHEPWTDGDRRTSLSGAAAMWSSTCCMTAARCSDCAPAATWRRS